MRPTLAEAFRRAILKGRGLSPDGQAVTMERVQQITPSGEVQVRGIVVPVAGEGLRNIRQGQQVATAWQRGRPATVFAHTARRSDAPVPLPKPGSPVVEELFIATRSTDGVKDVFFRNFDDVTPLRLDRFIVPSEIGTIRWGARNDRFFVWIFSRYYIFRFDRDPDEPFEPGTDPSDLVTLERSEDLSTNTTEMVTRLWDANGNPTSVTVTPANIPTVGGGLLISSCLDVNGALIASYLISGAGIIGPANVPVSNFASSVSPYVGQPGVTGGFAYPVVIDATNGAVLLSAWEDQDLFGPWDLLDFNAMPRVPVTYYTGSTGLVQAIVRPVTWVPANTFTFGVDPPFEGQDQIDATWWVGFSDVPTDIMVRLEPIFVLGNEVPAAQRVLGWVAWIEFQYNVAVGQTFSDPDYNSFHIPTDPSEMIQFPVPPFPVTAQTGGLAADPFTDAQHELYPVRRPSTGLSFARTLHRVIWRAPNNVAFTPSEQGLDVGGGDTPGFITTFDGGTTVQVSPTLRTSVGKRGLVTVLTDFLYQLDNPDVALPPEADVNFFVDGWDFGGAPTMDTTSTDFPAEQDDLFAFKALADLPEGVIQPTSFGSFALYVNNDELTLDSLGYFEDLPEPTP